MSTFADCHSTVQLDVHAGREDWLFLVGGTNRVLDIVEDPDLFPPLAEQWEELLLSRLARAEDLGIRYHHMLVPDKLSVYPERTTLDLTAGGAPSRILPGRLARHSLSARLEHCYIDLLGEMRAMRMVQDIYWRTDTHWTPEGAYLAYAALCRRVGVAPRAELLGPPAAQGAVLLDLGSKLENKPTEVWRRHHVYGTAYRRWANPIVEFKESSSREDDGGLHVGSAVWYTNPDPEAVNERLVIFGDSYAEYRPYLLTGLLAGTFAEVLFVWQSALDWRWIEEFRPTILVTELAERFHVAVPSDTYDHEAYERDTVARHQNDDTTTVGGSA